MENMQFFKIWIVLLILYTLCQFTCRASFRYNISKNWTNFIFSIFIAIDQKQPKIHPKQQKLLCWLFMIKIWYVVLLFPCLPCVWWMLTGLPAEQAAAIVLPARVMSKGRISKRFFNPELSLIAPHPLLVFKTRWILGLRPLFSNVFFLDQEEGIKSRRSTA